MCEHKNITKVSLQTVCLVFGCPDIPDCEKWQKMAGKYAIICQDCDMIFNDDNGGDNVKETVSSPN